MSGLGRRGGRAGTAAGVTAEHQSLPGAWGGTGPAAQPSSSVSALPCAHSPALPQARVPGESRPPEGAPQLAGTWEGRSSTEWWRRLQAVAAGGSGAWNGMGWPSLQAWRSPRGALLPASPGRWAGHGERDPRPQARRQACQGPSAPRGGRRGLCFPAPGPPGPRVILQPPHPLPPRGLAWGSDGDSGPGAGLPCGQVSRPPSSESARPSPAETVHARSWGTRRGSRPDPSVPSQGSRPHAHPHG